MCGLFVDTPATHTPMLHFNLELSPSPSGWDSSLELAASVSDSCSAPEPMGHLALAALEAGQVPEERGLLSRRCCLDSRCCNFDPGKVVTPVLRFPHQHTAVGCAEVLGLLCGPSPSSSCLQFPPRCSGKRCYSALLWASTPTLAPDLSGEWASWLGLANFPTWPTGIFQGTKIPVCSRSTLLPAGGAMN